MINLSTLFAGVNPNRFFEVYGFLGPQISVAKSQNVDVTISADGTSQSMAPAGEAEMRARIGASAGLGLKIQYQHLSGPIDVERSRCHRSVHFR